MDIYEIWYNMKNNSLTFRPKFLLFPDYPENDTIIPDFPVCINPAIILVSWYAKEPKMSLKFIPHSIFEVPRSIPQLFIRPEISTENEKFELIFLWACPGENLLFWDLLIIRHRRWQHLTTAENGRKSSRIIYRNTFKAKRLKLLWRKVKVILMIV